ncbi:MAG: methyltransferase domain-containing protein [Pseudomonadota bacterium]
MDTQDTSQIINALGEISWHSSTLDPSIDDVSRVHTEAIKARLPGNVAASDLRFLEVGAYAHYTGDILASEIGLAATVTDISSSTLALGRRHADAKGLNTDLVRRVAADFHDLPFEDASFDFVFIASALHHTLKWETVVRQLLRVTAPGGRLFFMNEPLRRDYCFYKFRTNRLHDFRPVETVLEQHGIIQTVAEPYLGSRPESLFGMVENQKIDINAFLSELRTEGEIVEMTLNSDGTMSDLDRELLEICADQNACSSLIVDRVSEGVAAAEAAMTDTDRRLGIGLPSPTEISEMASKISGRLAGLEQEGADRAIETASVFGAAVQIMVERSSANRQSDLGTFVWGAQDGVETAFRPGIVTVLSDVADIAPDIQTDAGPEIAAVFPDDDWVLDDSQPIKFVAMRNASARILLPSDPGDGTLLVSLRLYGAPIDAPFRIDLCAAGRGTVASFEVLQSESFLLSTELKDVRGLRELTLEKAALDNGAAHVGGAVTCGTARIIRIGT